MFHFQRTSDENDEWVEFGSPRIAALYSKVPKIKKKTPADCPATSEETVVPCVVTSASETGNALPCEQSSIAIPIKVVSDSTSSDTATGASDPNKLALVATSVVTSMQEITPSPKNSSSLREAADPKAAATKASVQKRPAVSHKRAPTKKKGRAGNGVAAASPHFVGTHPHPLPHQSNKVYEALSLNALHRYKEKATSTEDLPDANLPPPFGNMMANPMYIGFMNALAASSFYPGAPLMPPPPNRSMEPFSPALLNQSNPPSPAFPPNVAFPPFPPPPFSNGSLEVLTQAASAHSNGQQGQSWDEQPAQGRNPRDARDDWSRFFGPSSTGGN